MGGAKSRLTFAPLTRERWRDLATLFGARGACAGCWCMYWRLRRSEFERNKGEGNRRALRRLVAQGRPAGVLAYDGEHPIGWCAIAPREDFPVLQRSRVLARIDDRPVWSAPCFFIDKSRRRRGLTPKLLRAAVAYAGAAGARIVEGYPIDPRNREVPAVFAWTGLARAFERAGFKEVLRRSPTRPIFRKSVG
jgi:GNAT superfamily N-acetyltransferase